MTVYYISKKNTRSRHPNHEMVNYENKIYDLMQGDYLIEPS